jgi:hypothetical protein
MIRHPQPRSVRLSQQQASRGQTHRLANDLRRYFAPASTLPPPGIVRGATGNRNVSVTSLSSPNYTPNDQTRVQLRNGRAQWHFTTKFTYPPSVHATAELQNGTQELVIDELTPTGVVIRSSDATDHRIIHIHAAANSS